MDSPGTGLIKKILEISLRSKLWIDGVIICDIITVVRIGRMKGAEPKCGYTKLVKVIQMLRYAFDISPTVAVTVRKRINEHLIGKAAALFAVEGGRIGSNGFGADLVLGNVEATGDLALVILYGYRRAARRALVSLSRHSQCSIS